jgi:transposase
VDVASQELELEALRRELLATKASLVAAETARAESEKARAVIERTLELVLEHNKKLIRQLFGRRSEKLNKDELKQLALALGATEAQASAADPMIPVPEIGEFEEAAPEDAPQPDPKPGPTKKPRTSRQKTLIDPSVERVEAPVTEVPAEERCCTHCGSPMVRFGHAEHEVIEFVPAKFIVRVERREKLGCKTRGCQGEAVTAQREGDREKRLRAGPSLLAELVEAKCADALPVHRQGDRFRRMGISFPDETLYGYWKHATSLLGPIADAMFGRVMEDPNWVGVDDTGLDVLDKSSKGGKYRGHLWCFRASSGLVAFQFAKTWEAKEIVRWMALRGEHTYVQVDDYKGYMSQADLGEEKIDILPASFRLGCMMHVRRRFYDAFKAGDRRASKPVSWIKDIYKVEEEARGRPPDERLRLRTERSLPIYDEFEKWCMELSPKLGTTGKLTEAVRYAVQQKEYVRRCFTDGRFEIDNGATEREIRRPAIGRKNYLFTGSLEAGKRLATAYTLVQTCRNLGIDTRAYLVDVLTRLEGSWPVRRLTDLLPDRWRPDLE